MMKKIGEGYSSKVYLCEELANPNKKVALKLIKVDYLYKEEHFKLI